MIHPPAHISEGAARTAGLDLPRILFAHIMAGAGSIVSTRGTTADALHLM
jgi:hypothetical protein